MASKLVEAGGRASVIKSEKWTKSLDFYIITHVLKSEAGNFVTFNQGYCTSYIHGSSKGLLPKLQKSSKESSTVHLHDGTKNRYISLVIT